MFAGPNSAAEALRLQSDGNFWVINNVVRGMAVSYTHLDVYKRQPVRQRREMLPE